MKSLLVIVALVVACGRAPDAEQSATVDTTTAAVADSSWSGPKACELVSAADIKRITGVDVKAGITTNDYAGDSQCRFDRSTGADPLVMVTLHAHGNIEPYRRVPGSVAVSGIGDGAVWSDTNSQLAVRLGEAVFSFSFLSPPAKKQWGSELATLALVKLAPGN